MPPTESIQYQYDPQHLLNSEQGVYTASALKSEQMVINIGPQHPSTHGVLRLEVLLEGEMVKDVVPHLGYLHRCFEKHAEALPYNQIIPYVDRMDYVAAMNNEHAYAMGVEKMLGISEQLPKRVEFIRVLVAELNRLASHFIAVGTYAIDIGAFTPFLWLMRDREHILRMLEWISGARLLYNYIWIGGLFYDLPVGFEEKCKSFIEYLLPKLKELEVLLLENKIFKERTVGIGILPLATALDFGITGPMLRASGLRYDLRKTDAYSIYPELNFEVPIGKGLSGTKGDCWDRTFVRVAECYQSAAIIAQCLNQLTSNHKRDKNFDPQSLVPKKIRPQAQEYYSRAENPKGILGFYFIADGKQDIPLRCKVRAPSFCNLSVLQELSKGALVADLIAIIGSLDFVMGEVDR